MWTEHRILNYSTAIYIVSSINITVPVPVRLVGKIVCVQVIVVLWFFKVYGYCTLSAVVVFPLKCGFIIVQLIQYPIDGINDTVVDIVHDAKLIEPNTII